MPYTLVCYTRICLSITGGVTNLASNACGTPQAKSDKIKFDLSKFPNLFKLEYFLFVELKFFLIG